MSNENNCPDKLEPAEKIYIGENAIQEISEQRQVDLISVLYENGKNEDFTVEQFELLKSDKPYKDTEITDRKYKLLKQRIIGELVDARVKTGEFGFILQSIGTSLSRNIDTAIAKVFDKNIYEEIMLAEVDAVLKSNDEDENREEAGFKANDENADSKNEEE